MNAVFERMRHYVTFFPRRSFQKEPLRTLLRAFSWILCHRLLSRNAQIAIPVGETNFVLDLPPLGKQKGSAAIFLQRQYYEPLLEHLERLVKPGDVVFDCGANQGIYTCAFGALVGPGGRVEGFEPQKYAVESAVRSIRLNRFEHVRINRIAVSSKVGTQFLDTSSGAVGASIVKDLGRSSGEMVPVTTLDTFTKENLISRIDLIKMDIEGAEFDCLLGAQRVLEAFRPIIVLEADDRSVAWNNCRDLLSEHEYEAYTFSPGGELVTKPDLLSGHCSNIVFIANRSFRLR
jgi:FkbM family methyltransferase